MIKLTFLAVQRIVNDLFVLNRAFQQFISPAPSPLPIPLASPPPPEINMKLPHFIKAICAGMKNLTSVLCRRSFQPLQGPVKAPLQMNHLHFLITWCKWCLESFLGWRQKNLLLSLGVPPNVKSESNFSDMVQFAPTVFTRIFPGHDLKQFRFLANDRREALKWLPVASLGLFP